MELKLKMHKRLPEEIMQLPEKPIPAPVQFRYPIQRLNPPPSFVFEVV
jgi:hypothetical protein